MGGKLIAPNSLAAEVSPVDELNCLESDSKNIRLTLSQPAYHCRQWKSWRLNASPVEKGLINATVEMQ